MELGWKAVAPQWDAHTDSGPLSRAADALLMARFRSRLAAEYGRDSDAPPDSYASIIELIAGLHERGEAAVRADGRESGSAVWGCCQL